MKTGSDFNQRREPSVDHDLTICRSRDPRKQLQDRALAGAVVSDDAERFRAMHVKTDVFERPEIFFSFSYRQQLPHECALAIRIASDAISLRNFSELKIDHLNDVSHRSFNAFEIEVR